MGRISVHVELTVRLVSTGEGVETRKTGALIRSNFLRVHCVGAQAAVDQG